MDKDNVKGGFLKYRFMHSLKSRLILSFLAISIIPLVVVVTLAIYKFHGALRDQASNELIVIRDLKTTQIETYLNEIKQDIKLIAGLPYVKTAMQQLEIGARGQGLAQIRYIGYLNRPDLFHLDAYNPYAVYHGKYHAFFSELLKTKDYEDIWLVSADGDIVYTYAKRDEFATNLVVGQYRNTAPARIFKEIHENPVTDVVLMSDYSSFPPAGHVPVNFVGAPILVEGSLAGVLIYELSMEQINELMQVYKGFWETGETYLVGDEKLLRTKVRFEKGRDTDTYFKTSVDTSAVQRGLNGESGVDVILNYRNISVLSAYQAVDVDRFKWVLLAEVEESEAFAAANRLRTTMIVIILVTTIIVIIIGFNIGRSIAAPIAELADSATSIASGNLGLRVKSGAQHEIGHLAEAFNSMTEQLSILITSLELEISERRRAEEALNRHRERLEELVEKRTAALNTAKDQAESANIAKSEFLARMSHEIRTPLNAITGLTKVLLKSELTNDQVDYMDKILLASKNLMSVINDILDFSKVEAGRMELTRTVFDINQVMEHLADLFSDRAGRKNLELVFFTAPDVPGKVSGDPDRLTQVLTNLIGNAIKFTDAGEILVRVDLEGEAGTGGSRITVKFQVSDTGIGVPADALPTLFEPFTQAEGYLTRHHVGTGLGLAISRRLTELMGGRIWAESEPGQGSTFYFTADFDVEETLERQFIVPKNLRNLNVLVVDDSSIARQVLKDLLESFSFNVTTAHSGQDAINAFSRSASGNRPYQLILLDWKMPGLDGIETAKHIRGLYINLEDAMHDDGNTSDTSPWANGRTPVPIIMMVSAYGNLLVKNKFCPSAVNKLLLKPVKTSELFNTIMALFGRTGAQLPTPAKTGGRLSIGQLSGRRSLVVEDNALNRDVVVALLVDKGLSVETVENGQAAVDKVNGAPPGYYDVVLMDIQMPVMDGYNATRKIRKFEHHQMDISRQPDRTTGKTGTRIPIIALTAHALTGEREKCLAADMDDYLAKPINEDELDRLLLKWLLPKSTKDAERQDVNVPAPGNSHSRLDVEGALNRLGGRKMVYGRVLKKFGPEFQGAPDEIRRLAALGEMEPVKRAAHSLKGAAATIGAMALSDAAERLEGVIVDQPWNLQQPLEVLEKALENAFDAIDRYLEKELKDTEGGR